MIQPFEDKVVVRPEKVDEKVSSSGLVIAALDEEKPSVGVVEAVGPGKTFDDGSRLNISDDLKPGDKVFYAKYSGTEYEDLLILAFRDILAVIVDE